MCKMNLRELKLCYNLIEDIPADLCKLKLITLGIKCNSFLDIHYNFVELLRGLSILELDWFKY